jgi:hypothetical protein
MSHTFSPEMHRRTEALALTAAFLTAILAVVVFFPAEGRVLVPVHAGLTALLGQMVFVLPLGLTLLSALAFVRRVRPGLQIPRGRLVGLGLITIAMLPADHLLGQSTGLLGDWFTRLLVNAFGGPFTVGLSLALVTLGTALAFNFTPPRPPIAAR